MTINNGEHGPLHSPDEAPSEVEPAALPTAEHDMNAATRKREAVVAIAVRLAHSEHTWLLGKLQDKRDAASSADAESRQKADEEVAKWQQLYDEAIERDLLQLERLYDTNPDLVNTDDEESVRAFQEAGAAFLRLNWMGDRIDTAAATIEAYMGIIGSPDQVVADGETQPIARRLDDYAQAQAMDSPFSSQPYLETLSRLLTRVYQGMHGDKGKREANHLMAPLREAIQADDRQYREPFAEGSRASGPWLEQLPIILDQLRTMKSEELPAKLTRFLERYASGERLNTLNAMN